MAVNLPGPVVNFLNTIGVPWPYIDEDAVRQFATLTRQFGQAVDTTHQNATQAVGQIAQLHKAASTERMQSGWATMSGQYVDALVKGCGVLADALDVAAGYIVAQKAAAIAILAGMAVTFAADQGAALLTGGLAELAAPLIVVGARRLVQSLVMDIEQYIIGQVIEAAAKPLFDQVQTAMAGLDWSQVNTGGGAGSGSGFSLDASGVRAQTAALRDYATTMRSHGDAFQQGVQGLNF